MNIILNALHAMPEGGNIDIVMERDRSYLKVLIIDEGTGIEVENIEKIFDPFFSTKDTGTGLGLAIAHRIMVSHGGFISASSNEKTGSTFTVTFPVPDELNAASAIEPGHEGAARDYE